MVLKQKKNNYSFFKSLRFRLTVILVIIGIIPGILVERGIVSSYKDRAVSIRTVNVMNQCDILCDQMVGEGYLTNPRSLSLDGKLDQLATIYNGRVMIMDDRLNIVKDTFGLDQSKTMVSEEVITSLLNSTTAQYVGEGYIEMLVPIIDKTAGACRGVMLVSISTNEIDAGVRVLENRGRVVMGITAAIMAILGYVMAGILVRPFNKVRKAIEDITEGNMDEDISVPDYAETQMITEAFNRMLLRIRTLDDSRSEFVSNVSHELKTPLTSMKVLADSLIGQEDVPVELYREFMQDIGDEIDRENKIITDLLSLVKMDKKAETLNLAPVSINDTLELIVKRLKPIADTRGIRLLVENVKPVTAMADEVKLTLAFTNLVENAIKYNVDNGWVRVSLNADNKYFYVVVEDCGIGIPEDCIDHIFERFYRVDKSHSRQIGGTGLGLAITRSAIRMHHGAVKVYSKEGEGTRFSVRVPLTAEDKGVRG